MYRIQVMSPSLCGNEKKYVEQVIDSSWIGPAGEFVDRFEREWADTSGTSGCVSTANGTVSLHLAVLALGAGPGDEVIVPALTYVATANAVRFVGAEPVFVDVDPQTWCMDPAQIERAITRRTKGVIPVHLFGHPADMDPINEIAGLYKLWVLEDAAQGHFATYKGRPVGSLGDMASFSFHVGKIVTCGEGGAITSSNARLLEWIRMIRSHGMDPARRFFHPLSGYNYRLTNLQCAILCAQLERTEEILARRRVVFDHYHERLSEIPGIGFRPCAPWSCTSPWLFCITVDPDRFGASRDELMSALAEESIESRPFYVPLQTLPPFRESAQARAGELPVTRHLSETAMYLPSSTDLTAEQVDFVCDAVARISERRRRR